MSSQTGAVGDRKGGEGEVPKHFLMSKGGERRGFPGEAEGKAGGRGKVGRTG